MSLAQDDLRHLGGISEGVGKLHLRPGVPKSLYPDPLDFVRFNPLQSTSHVDDW